VCAAERWPSLPATNAAVTIPAQQWPLRPGPRTISLSVHYPDGRLDRVNARTGLMLSLHNWGGTGCVGTAEPQRLADAFNVVALCVDYLQSGDSPAAREPYDFGYLQALDALRALWWVRDQLRTTNRSYDDARIFACGGSGGGNVALMANKLAPRTFTCVIDMCGMKRLTDDIAFNLPGGSGLNARWSRDPQHPHYLSADAQEIRFVACPEHLWLMKRLGCTAKILTVHGVEDRPTFDHAEEMVRLMRGCHLDVEPHFVSPQDVDGKVFTTAGHALGDRTAIVLKLGAEYLGQAASPRRLRRAAIPDFDRREELRFRTSNGAYVISYASGYPVGRFEARDAAPPYPNHSDLSFVLADNGAKRPLRSQADWELRRRHVQAGFMLAAGSLPGPCSRVPLDVRVQEDVQLGTLRRLKLTYQSDLDDRVPAYLFLPAAAKTAAGPRRPAMLCLHQTTALGKAEAAGLGGDPDLKYALELARRGYVTLAPDYPSLGEHTYDFAPQRGYASGTMKGIWDNIRAVDLLETRPEADPERIGVLGHSLGGHNAIFLGLFDCRVKAVVSSCGFCPFSKDDVPSWTGPRYMPRIAAQFHNDAGRVPFDFPELIAALAPRAFLAVAAEKDNDFDVEGVKEAIASARTIFRLYGAETRLAAIYPPTGHAFPADARDAAYKYLDEHLRNRP
jgi:dienelactone hydrolase